MDCVIYLVQTEKNRSRRQSRERLLDYAARYLAQIGLMPPLPPLLSAEQGKPYFEGEPFHFSVSHSGDYWACAFGKKPLGLDIQRIEDHDKWAAIARRFFHPQEVDYLEGKSQRDFYGLWCAKEAWVKYTGQGIGSLKDFSVVDTRGIKAEIKGVPLVFPPPPPGYWMALSGCDGYCLKESVSP